MLNILTGITQQAVWRTNEGERARRGRYQFSIRGLLLLITVLCVWLALQVNGARRQRDAVRAIEQVAFNGVAYDYQLDDGEFSDTARPRVPAVFVDALGIDFFANVAEVELFGRGACDALPHVRTLRTVTDICFGCTTFSIAD